MHRAILTFGLLFSFASNAAKLQCLLTPQLFGVYFKHHYLYKSLTPDIKAHTVDQFIKALDPSKSTFLESDVVKIRKNVLAMFETLSKGNCTALSEAQTISLERISQSEAFVKKFFEKPYKLDESVEIVIDPTKRQFPKNEEEKKQVLTKLIHFQMLNYFTAQVKPEDAKKQLIHRYELSKKRMEEKALDNLIEIFLEAFASSLDPHSSYLSKNEMEDFQIQMEVSLEGIGAELSNQDGFTVIEKLVPGGSADRSGATDSSKKLQPKDKIIAVSQEGKEAVSVIDMELPKVVRLIRGSKGTKVTLTVLRQAENKNFQVTLTREKIELKDHAANINYENKTTPNGKTVKVGVLELPSFYGDGGKGVRSSYTDVKKLLIEANKNKVDAIVLNLSKNGGGLLDEAVKISGLFINKGAIVGTKDTQRFNVLKDEEEGTVYSGPLVVLISRISASASEILAGALKDYKRAVILGGDHTFGKGSVQVVSTLPFDLGGMKVTTGMFFIPGGNSTQHLGVSADINTPSMLSTDEIGEKNLDYSLPPQKVTPFLAKEANLEGKDHWSEVTTEEIKKLAALSKIRVEKSPKFQEIVKNFKESQKNKGALKLATMKKQAEEEKKKEKKEDTKLAQENDKKKEEALVEEGVAVAVDYATLFAHEASNLKPNVSQVTETSDASKTN